MASVAKRRRVHNGVEGETWVVRYTDLDGKRRMKSFEKKKDADAFRTKADAEVRSGIHVPDSDSITVEKALDLFLETVDRRAAVDDRMRNMTAYTWRNLVKNHIRPQLGRYRLNQLTAPVLQNWLNSLAYDESNPRSKSLLTKALMVLRLTLTDAQARGLVKHNIIREARPRIPGNSPDRVAVPTKAEVNAALAAASGPFRPVLYLAVFSGLRMGEIRGLRWEDVNFEQCTISVTQAADLRGRIGRTKSRAGKRTIPMARELVVVLKEWKLASRGGKGLVVAGPTGDPKRATTVHLSWVRLQIRMGLCAPQVGKRSWETTRGKYHFHALRHVTASLLIEADVAPKMVQTIMGHASIKMTFDTYGHLFQARENMALAIDRLSSALGS